jgi:hypothetical protein
MSFRDICENFSLLELSGKYSSFIIDLETELILLRHIRECIICQDVVKKIILQEEVGDKWWENLFSETLPKAIGEEQPFVEPCPHREDYNNLDSFIKARIKWRIQRVETIKEDAKIELSDIQNRLDA